MDKSEGFPNEKEKVPELNSSGGDKAPGELKTHNPFRLSHTPAQEPPFFTEKSEPPEKDRAGPSDLSKQPQDDSPAYIGSSNEEKKHDEKTGHLFPEPHPFPEPQLPEDNEGTRGVGHVSVEMSKQEESPPGFAPYEAEFFETDDGDIISHDHHLNEDGEALYRFLLGHALRTPKIILHCGGTHLETRTRVVHRTVNGRSQSYTETYTVTVTDFSFDIDITRHVVAGPVNWSIADDEPTYRGLMVRQFELPKGRKKATDEEVARFKSWESERTSRGLPPWISRDEVWNEGDPNGCSRLESSKTVRQWADEYCATKKVLKEFVYEKFVHGWNLGALEQSIRVAILQTQYHGNTSVYFSTTGTKIIIRADNTLSRMLSKTWVKFFLWIFLIYPFIWLFKRYNSRGGGRWEVCGGAYGLKHLEPLGTNCPLAEGDIRDPASLPTPRIIDTDNGRRRLIGFREGEWFKNWEAPIKRFVVSQLITGQPMIDYGEAPSDPAQALDGYVP